MPGKFPAVRQRLITNESPLSILITEPALVSSISNDRSRFVYIPYALEPTTIRRLTDPRLKRDTLT